jgi:hypothetical protein
MSKWLALLKKGNTPDDNATKATKSDLTEEKHGFVAFVAYLPGNLQEKAAANDPDRWCWPNSPAMNSREIEIFHARLYRFTDKGLEYDDAERYADKLVMRDRELDDRRLCLECAHLNGRWRCGNWKAAHAGGYDLSRDGILLLQRCKGFTNAVA